LAQEARNAALNSRNQEAIDMHMAMATAWNILRSNSSISRTCSQITS
jgi:hypothetical protein